MSLAQWLAELGLQKYLGQLCDDGFDSLRRLMHVTEEDLRDLGMKKGHSRQLLAAIPSLPRECMETASSGAAVCDGRPGGDAAVLLETAMPSKVPQVQLERR